MNRVYWNDTLANWEDPWTNWDKCNNWAPEWPQMFQFTRRELEQLLGPMPDYWPHISQIRAIQARIWHHLQNGYDGY